MAEIPIRTFCSLKRLKKEVVASLLIYSIKSRHKINLLPYEVKIEVFQYFRKPAQSFQLKNTVH